MIWRIRHKKRQPGFVHAPNRLPAAVAGTTSDALLHITDWLPTLVGLGEGGGAAVAAASLDGHDAWSALAGRAPSPRTSAPAARQLPPAARSVWGFLTAAAGRNARGVRRGHRQERTLRDP